MTAHQTEDVPVEPGATRVELLDAVMPAFDHPPARTGDLVECALRCGARPAVVDLLRRLPDRRYLRPRDLWEELPEVPLGD